MAFMEGVLVMSGQGVGARLFHWASCSAVVSGDAFEICCWWRSKSR